MSKVAQSCPTVCDPVDIPGSSVHGILQAIILEWVVICFSRGSSWTRDRTQLSHTAGRCFNLWATREAQVFANVCLVRPMVFPVVMYGCESWTIKKAGSWRIDAFELWCWRRLLRVPWTARRSNQSIKRKSVLNILWKDWCWSWNSNTSLATWCEELIHLKRPRCWERLKAEGEGDNRGLDGWMASLTQWTWVWASSGSWWWTGKPGMLQSMGSQRVRHDWANELKFLQNISANEIEKIPWNPRKVSLGSFYLISAIFYWW